MPSIVKILRVAADPNRLRILLLLKGEELTVAELQEILAMGQSTISTHLSQLKQAGLVEDRRTGKNNLYRLAAQSLPTLDQPKVEPSVLKGHDFGRAEDAGTKKNGASAPEASTFLDDLLARAALEIPEAARDQSALRRVLHKRQDKTRAFFDSVAGRLNRNYVPGKSWKSLAEAFLRLLPPLTIADLGAGEGGSALLLSRTAKRVIAVDSSARMIEVGRTEALRAGIQNIDFRLGDMEELPLAAGEVELVFFSQSLHHAQHPDRALAEAARILVPGGRIVILDLARHRFEEARELYADEWLGFPESELEAMLAHAGFTRIETTLVDKEAEPPQFQTLLAVAERANPAARS
jgi:ubiquinone/menaquinone biosynthesis C-methylase UbiE/DNA-binding transcriptional ArsR family regulator